LLHLLFYPEDGDSTFFRNTSEPVPDYTASHLTRFVVDYKVSIGWNLGRRGCKFEELRNLYSGPNIIRMIQSRRIRWVEHAVRMGKDECIQGFGGKARRKLTSEKI
jgi:hypothetical protein